MPTAFLTYDWQPSIETKSLFSKKIQLAIEHGASRDNSYILIITLLQVVKIHVLLSCLPGSSKKNRNKNNSIKPCYCLMHRGFGD